MRIITNHKFWAFVGRFSLVYVLTYTAAAVIFLTIQNALPAPGRVALDFFQPYALGVREIAAQVLVGGVIALVLYPFYDTIVKEKSGWLVLFAALWGVALLGSLEPKPGSFEGMLYLEAGWTEHLLVLAAGALQTLLFCRLFLPWERRQKAEEWAEERARKRTEKKAGAGPKRQISAAKLIRGYVGRFTFLHVVIYILVGAAFYQISGYEEALATMEEFALWRDLENIVMPFVILFGQVFRGGILALLLYPFYPTYLDKRHGWLLLFGLLFGLKVMVIAISIPASFQEFILALETSKTGLPEIIAQTLLFSGVFFAWERRKMKKAGKEEVKIEGKEVSSPAAGN